MSFLTTITAILFSKWWDIYKQLFIVFFDALMTIYSCILAFLHLGILSINYCSINLLIKEISRKIVHVNVNKLRALQDGWKKRQCLLSFSRS